MGRVSSAADVHNLSRLSHPGLSLSTSPRPPPSPCPLVSLAPTQLSHPWLSPGCLQQACKHTHSPGTGIPNPHRFLVSEDFLPPTGNSHLHLHQ